MYEGCTQSLYLNKKNLARDHFVFGHGSPNKNYIIQIIYILRRMKVASAQFINFSIQKP